METEEQVKEVVPGDAVRIVSETYGEHIGLVTAVHGRFGSENAAGPYVPCINVVFVTTDPAKHDPYGQQIERLTSLQHYGQGPSGMPRPGRYWRNV